jgi:two-component system, NarL family, response regulator LiaR
VAALLDKHPDVKVVDTQTGGNGTLHTRVDVALFDTFGQRKLGLDRIKQLADDDRVGAVAVYSFSASEPLIAEALRAGANGFLFKGLTGPELAEAVIRIGKGETVVAGEPGSKSRKKASAAWPGQEQGLTARQSEILALLAEGLTAAAVGEALFLSENTVKTHIAQILRRLGASNRAQAIAKAASLGLLDRSKITA